MAKLKKLTPDPIQDAIVEVKFSSSVPSSVLTGQLYADLVELGFVIQENKLTKSADGGIFLEEEPSSIFVNEVISINLKGGSVTFNVINGYPLWENYFEQIKGVLKTIDNKDIISSYNRVGIRYINALYNEDIYKCLSEEVNITYGEKKPDRLRTNAEFLEDNKRIILRTGNNYIDEQKGLPLSLLDIDVIQEEPMKDLETLLEVIDNCHNKEKEYFEYCMSEDALNKYNPTY